MVTLPTNFKVAKFDNDKGTAILRQLEKEIDAVRFDPGDGTKIELPVKLRVHDSIFVPLAKWAMLLAGNYRCVTKDGMRTAQEAVHSDIETSRSVYNFVFDLCVKLGAKPDDLVPFEKYAAAAQSLVRPASAARALAERRAQHRARRQAGAAHRQAEGPEPSGDRRPGGAGRRAARGQPQEGRGGVAAVTSRSRAAASRHARFSLPPRSGGEGGAASKRSEDAVPGGGLVDCRMDRK